MVVYLPPKRLRFGLPNASEWHFCAMTKGRLEKTGFISVLRESPPPPPPPLQFKPVLFSSLRRNQSMSAFGGWRNWKCAGEPAATHCFLNRSNQRELFPLPVQSKLCILNNDEGKLKEIKVKGSYYGRNRILNKGKKSLFGQFLIFGYSTPKTFSFPFPKCTVQFIFYNPSIGLLYVKESLKRKHN